MGRVVGPAQGQRGLLRLVEGNRWQENCGALWGWRGCRRLQTGREDCKRWSGLHSFGCVLLGSMAGDRFIHCVAVFTMPPDALSPTVLLIPAFQCFVGKGFCQAMRQQLWGCRGSQSWSRVQRLGEGWAASERAVEECRDWEGRKMSEHQEFCTFCSCWTLDLRYFCRCDFGSTCFSAWCRLLAWTPRTSRISSS